MAKCSSCGTNVGCGCNLKNGMCAFCVQKKKDAITINPVVNQSLDKN